MVDRAKQPRERKRRAWLFLGVSVLAHGAIVGLVGTVPPAQGVEESRSATVPLALFTPGGGSVASAAAEPPPSQQSAGATSAAPPRRAPIRSTTNATRRADEGDARPTDPNGAETDAVGTGDDVSSDEFLDALMASSGPRRAQPGACPDPIIGTWKARRYDPDQEKRAEFLLRVQSHEGGDIRGRITLRAWSGRSQRPPRCAPGVFFHTVRMPARGTFAGGSVSFEASSFTRIAHCVDPGFEYNLDHFTGEVSGDRFRAVNNDGGHEVDTPYVFERIACH